MLSWYNLPTHVGGLARKSSAKATIEKLPLLLHFPCLRCVSSPRKKLFKVYKHDAHTCQLLFHTKTTKACWKWLQATLWAMSHGLFSSNSQLSCRRNFSRTNAANMSSHWVIESSFFTKHSNLSNRHTNWRRLNASASISWSCKDCHLTSKSKKKTHLLALLWAAPCLASAVQALVNCRVIWRSWRTRKLGLWHSRDFGLWIFLPHGETGQLGGSLFTIWVPLASQASPRWFQSTPGWSLKNTVPARHPTSLKNAAADPLDIINIWQASSLQLLIHWFRVHKKKTEPSHWYLWISRYTCDVRIAKHVVQVASWPARTSWRKWR